MAQAVSSNQGQRIRALPLLISAISASLITALCFATLVKPREARHPLPPAATPTLPPTLGFIDSLIVPPSVPADAEIALLNLACAPVAPSSPKSRTIRDHLKTLDEWASTVSDQTRKNYHRYLENPKEFSNETEWKLAMMCTILGKDFKVRYDFNMDISRPWRSLKTIVGVVVAGSGTKYPIEIRGSKTVSESRTQSYTLGW
jgi:hypothetical protein